MSSNLALLCALTLTITVVNGLYPHTTKCELLRANSCPINLYVSHDPTSNHFTSVQDAIQAVPESNTRRHVIHISPGVYNEKIRIPASRRFITIQGSGIDKTILTYNDTHNSTGSTTKSSSFTIQSDYFVARDVTFRNDAPRAKSGDVGAQAVALKVSGDMAAFYNCKIVSGQDTLYDDSGRHYFKNCTIEGSIDFIFGAGRSLYKGCDLVVNAESFGAVTAQKRMVHENKTSGYSFVNCNIHLGDGGSSNAKGKIYLGRAWGDAPVTIFSRTKMDDCIHPWGWDNWGDGARNSTALYMEYNNRGAGANRKDRVKWSYAVTEESAIRFMSLTYVNGQDWLVDENDNNEDIFTPNLM